MRVFLKNRRGQFLVLTAFLVVVILSSAIIVSYKRIQENSFSNAVNLSSSMTDINNSISDLLGFTAGYYGSMIQVTGNATYAQMKTVEYLKRGLVTVAHSHVDWGTSFTLENVNIHTNWYNSTSSTDGDITVSYDIPSIGLMGAKFKTYASIKVQILETIGSQALVKVTVDKDRVDLSLLRSNFRFFKYDSSGNRWNYIELQSDPVVTTSGEYLLTIPAGINLKAYFLQVVDRRGIMVATAYVQGVGTLNKKDTSYKYSFTWDPLYVSLSNQPMEVELLQNGTLRWLGQKLDCGGTEKPIPPIPVKGIHVNQTCGGVNKEVPFQIEDWSSSYQVPFGITSNTTIFNENCMIVFLVDHTVDHITVWWDGRDTAKQTPYAYDSSSFASDKPYGPFNTLDNGVLTLDFSNFAVGVKATTKVSSIVSQSTFMRINTKPPIYGSALSYVIHNGVVRDIVQQEPEWSGGITTPLCPDVFAHIVLTLPAKANYYTFKLRTVFVPTTQSRTINELSVLQLKAYAGLPLTEDGRLGNIPMTSGNNLFYNGGTAYEHQWSEYVDASNRGAGILIRSDTNTRLYSFDSVAGQKTGAVRINTANGVIEFSPVCLQRGFPVSGFTQAFDMTWYGAVLNFSSGSPTDTIYPSSGGSTGLWVLVERPPTVQWS